MSHTPIFIALEGIDGAGTTTQCQRLVRWLEAQGRRALSTREPSDGPIGTLIRQILRGQHDHVDPASVALLFAADRLHHLESEIRPALAAGRDVVSDRYVLSSLAYQGVNSDAQWVEFINNRADLPGLTLFVDVPVDVCLERLVQRGDSRELFETRDMLSRVDAAYRRLAEQLAEQHNVVVIDGTPSPDDVAAQIVDVVQSQL